MQLKRGRKEAQKTVLLTKWTRLVRTAKGLVINYGEGGATKWENRGSETFCATPSRQGKTFRAPPF